MSAIWFLGNYSVSMWLQVIDMFNYLLLLA